MFPAHRVILAAGSEYFERLLGGSYRESSQNRISIDEDPKLFDVVLAWIYGIPTGHLDVVTDLANLQVLMKYQVRDLDPEAFVANIQPTKEDFDIYLNFVAENYPQGIPETILDTIHLALDDGNYDLNKLPEDTILRLFTLSGYTPRNLYRLYSELSLIDSKFLPEELRGRIPNLSKEIYDLVTRGLDRDIRLMAVSKPEREIDSDGKPYWAVNILDGSNRTWTGRLYTKDAPEIYDIFTGRIKTLGRPYLPNESPLLDMSSWYHL